MQANPFLGVIFHMLGGLAAGSFYIPFRRVRGWAWESYWLVGGVFSWIVAPWVLAALTCPQVVQVLRDAPWASLVRSYGFGLMWGVGGLTFGLTMRYLGVSLGMAVALGYCAAFGTLMPPLFAGQMADIVTSPGGQVVLVGVAVCLAGIFVTGMAGMSKERELSEEEKRRAIEEFDFFKGIAVATFSGVMSAGMSYGIAAGKPIAELARRANLAAGATPEFANLWQNTPVFVVILAGGFTANFLWCLALNLRNRSAGDYLDPRTPLANNYFFSALAGTTWYLQFMFYGMGTTQMGPYDFSSWSLHMASIILFSTAWGILLREWQGTSGRTRWRVALGLAVLVASLVTVGYGNHLKDQEVRKQSSVLGPLEGRPPSACARGEWRLGQCDGFCQELMC